MTTLYVGLGVIAFALLMLGLLIRSVRAEARAEVERDALEVRREKQARMLETLSRPTLAGAALRARMRARRMRAARGDADPPVPGPD